MISQTIHAERVLLLGWGRALLLQFAHPAVAQGIVDHSEFLRDRRARWTRLRRTLDAMLTLTYGAPAQADAVARGINAVHDRVHGRVGGAPYSAHDPALLGWVHATLVESFLLAYELYVAPLSPADRDRYCAETAEIEPRLGIPEGRLPRRMDELNRYMRTMLDGPELTITEPARRLAAELFRPVPRVMLPAMWLARLPAVGLLPARLRSEYGFAWSPRHALALRVSARGIRGALSFLPRSLRHWSAARRGVSGVSA
jgi:uncharacterized protein (DUF2236 family)